jgi:carboxypeptidase C (cathepsin A)
VALLAVLSVVDAAPAADAITMLPGWNTTLPSPQYSGYLNISSTKHLHYWFVYSEKSPSSDPVILWLNGGPGCSSLDGFIYEHGPFQVDPNDYSNLLLRQYRWSSIANVLYLEAPVGVGFSYSDNPSVDYKCTDDTTANDNLAAVQLFFTQKFPEFAGHEFYLTGESYAGVYVPTLAEAILNAQKAGTYTGAPLRGMAVGNGCTGDQIGICGFGSQGTYYEWEYLTQLALIPNTLKNQINMVCNWTAAMNNTPNSISPQCQVLLEEASAIISNVDLYDVYGDCVNSYPPADAEGATYRRMKAPSKGFFANQRLGDQLLGGPDACIDSRAATAYLSQPQVMQAIHVRDPGFVWGVCTDAPGWTYQSTRANLPRDTYPALIANYRVIIYNGDWDACVPYTDNEAWTVNMGYKVTKAWHAWSYTSTAGNANQVAGYATKYNTGSTSSQSAFTFITIKGGRHECPETAPAQAIQMILNLINNADF